MSKSLLAISVRWCAKKVSILGTIDHEIEYDFVGKQCTLARWASKPNFLSNTDCSSEDYKKTMNSNAKTPLLDPVVSAKRYSMQRRGFLQGLSVAASLSAFSLSPVSSLLAQEAKAAGLKLGIQIYSLRGFPVDVALDHTKNLGFEEVEFFSGMFPLTATDDEISKMVQKVKGLGLRISAHGVNGFTKDAAANRKVFEFAKKAGIKNISAAPTPESRSITMDLRTDSTKWSMSSKRSRVAMLESERARIWDTSSALVKNQSK
jgi:hypothetical protein